MDDATAAGRDDANESWVATGSQPQLEKARDEAIARLEVLDGLIWAGDHPEVVRELAAGPDPAAGVAQRAGVAEWCAVEILAAHVQRWTAEDVTRVWDEREELLESIRALDESIRRYAGP